MSAQKKKKTIKVQQYRSGIGFPKPQRRILRSLGLEKLNRVKELPDGPNVRGMVNKISHLVRIVEEAE